jgi:hypothetical protein
LVIVGLFVPFSFEGQPWAKGKRDKKTNNGQKKKGQKDQQWSEEKGAKRPTMAKRKRGKKTNNAQKKKGQKDQQWPKAIVGLFAPFSFGYCWSFCPFFFWPLLVFLPLFLLTIVGLFVPFSFGHCWSFCPFFF